MSGFALAFTGALQKSPNSGVFHLREMELSQAASRAGAACSRAGAPGSSLDVTPKASQVRQASAAQRCRVCEVPAGLWQGNRLWLYLPLAERVVFWMRTARGLRQQRNILRCVRGELASVVGHGGVIWPNEASVESEAPNTIPGGRSCIKKCLCQGWRSAGSVREVILHVGCYF